jgi:hypothetical protein
VTTPPEHHDWVSSGRNYYWPAKAIVDECEGYLVIEGSGWEAGAHWSGAHRILLNSPDIEFWRWLIARHQESSKMLTDEDIENERGLFKSKT